jgi:hypothetical protein
MMEVKKAKKTRKKTEKSGTAKKTTKEGVKEKRTKERKKVTKKEVIRIKDVRELVDYCKQQFGRKPFQGASIDFHPKKPAYVYIPDDNSVTKVDAHALRLLKGEKCQECIG